MVEVAVPCNVTQTMKYSVHDMQICELWRYYLNYRAIFGFGISDTGSPAFNCSNSDLCAQRKCSGSVGTASFRQFRGCDLHVVSFFLRISLEDTTTLKLFGNNRQTRVTMRHHLTGCSGCLSMPLPLSWRAFPHFLPSMSFWTKLCHERTNDLPVKLPVQLSLHNQRYQAGRGRAANCVIGALAQQSLHYVIFSRSSSFRCRCDPGKHAGVGAIGWYYTYQWAWNRDV